MHITEIRKYTSSHNISTINICYSIHTTFWPWPSPWSQRLGLGLGIGLKPFGLGLILIMSGLINIYDKRLWKEP